MSGTGPSLPITVAGSTAVIGRRRRLAEVFGEVLPSTTGDERDRGAGEGAGRDAWLRSQVPPHHGPSR